jgi:hypothetical protein
MPSVAPSLKEIEALHSALTRGEREELLQEILVAASRGAQAMLAVVDAWLLDKAVRRSIEQL